ncbi:hypothetical protein [Streptomyces sp. NPDC055036]
MIINDFISKHGVRLYAVLAALVPLLALWRAGLPWEAALAASAALLGVGEVSQRHEDTKTLQALYQDSPFVAEVQGK